MRHQVKPRFFSSTNFDLIKKQVYTYKSMTKQLISNVITFKVAKEATKNMLKDSFIKIFKMNVKKICTINEKPRIKHIRTKKASNVYKPTEYKKVMIYLEKNENSEEN